MTARLFLALSAGYDRSASNTYSLNRARFAVQADEFFTGSQTCQSVFVRCIRDARSKYDEAKRARLATPDPAASEDAYLFDRPYVIMFVNFAL